MSWVWDPLGAITLGSAVMLLVLSVLFLRARASQFNWAFAGYTAASAVQKCAAAISLHFEQDPIAALWWYKLALWTWIPIDATFLHSVVAFSWRRGPPAQWLVWLIYGAGAALGGGALIWATWLDALFWPPWYLFIALSLVLLALALVRMSTGQTRLARQEAKYLAIYLGVATPFLLEGLVLYVMHARLPLWEIALAYALATGIMLVGILRHHVFDIDLKIKIALERSTVVAIVAGVAFVASEVIEQLVGVDQLVPAILVAAVITLGIRPLQRWAARLADTAMPGVQDTDEYRLVRKRDIYTAALEGALVDGMVSDRERDMLLRLQQQLGLSASEAGDLERTLAA